MSRNYENNLMVLDHCPLPFIIYRYIILYNLPISLLHVVPTVSLFPPLLYHLPLYNPL